MGTRAFICVEVDEEIRKRVSELQQVLSGGSLVKWVEEENLHVTLKFLGDISDEQVFKTSRVLRRVTRGVEPFEVEVGGLGTFPRGRQPQVLWVDVKDAGGRMEEIERGLAEGLEPLGVEKENRRFAPHLTIGRVRGSRGVGALLDRISRNRKFRGGRQAVRGVTFMRSVLAPSGPVYSPLERVHFG